ncbi:hypothetical protein [Poseidonibacter sp.]|uniref:hypothetical protein n=1 Tax=Poseidonibacter sp. TaxID=2321188 RepID=UPI003C711204
MGMCKKCSEVNSALEMTDGYCKECYTPELSVPKVEEVKTIDNSWMDIEQNLVLTDEPKEPTLNQFQVIVLLGGAFAIIAKVFEDIHAKDIHYISIMFFIIVLIGIYKIFKPSQKKWDQYEHNKNVYKHRLALNEKFKSKFIILNEFDESKYTNLQILNVEDRTQEKAMYKIYANAELLHADAIIINNSNVSTQVYGSVSTDSKGSVSGRTSSSNTFHFTVTLLKKISNTNKI